MQRYAGSITDIKGVRIGQWTNLTAKTGCSVVLFDNGAVAGVQVSGAAPGTRETDLLRGYHLVNEINAIVLSGGSAFGLAAADGVMRFLEEQKIGYVSGGFQIPIVPAAVLYDLGVGDGWIRPNALSGYEACRSANEYCLEGAVGAGTGATIGKLYGQENASPGGLGTASVTLYDDVVVGAVVAVNALGEVFNPQNGQKLSGCRPLGQNKSGKIEQGGNTTIGVVATNATLDRERCNRMAEMGQDGLVLAIRPVHTPFDGDTIFAASTGEIALPEAAIPSLFAAATEVTARAVQNAILAAQGE